MEPLFFDDWQVVVRTLVVGTLAYVALIALLRISGNRTLSKMNAFDFVITVALGSTVATILLNADVSLTEGVVALALLVGLQYVVTWSGVRAPWVRKVVTGEPSLLFSNGHFLEEAMRVVRVNENEVRASIRAAGIADLHDVAAVIMETDGSFSVIRAADRVEAPSVDGVRQPGSDGSA